MRAKLAAVSPLPGHIGVRRVWVQNKYYPEGHGTTDNFWSIPQLELIFDSLLVCGFQESSWKSPACRPVPLPTFHLHLQLPTRSPPHLSS